MLNLIFGDSYVEGFELEEEIGFDAFNSMNWSDKDREEVLKYRSSKVFHKVLGDKLNIKFTPIAATGHGNSWIAKQVINYVEESRIIPSNVIVCWSSPDRIHKHYRGNEFIYSYSFINLKYIEGVKTVIDKVLLRLWSLLESKFFGYEKSLDQESYEWMKITAAYLNAKGINFIFIKSIHNNINLKDFTKQSVKYGVHDYCIRKFGWKSEYIGKGGHFLSEGHRIYGEYLHRSIGKYIKKKKSNLI